MTLTFTQSYKLNDSASKAWAMQVARTQVLKQLLALAIANWRYTMHYEELHTADGRYTFSITLDEQPL